MMSAETQHTDPDNKKVAASRVESGLKEGYSNNKLSCGAPVVPSLNLCLPVWWKN